MPTNHYGTAFCPTSYPTTAYGMRSQLETDCRWSPSDGGQLDAHLLSRQRVTHSWEKAVATAGCLVPLLSPTEKVLLPLCFISGGDSIYFPADHCKWTLWLSLKRADGWMALLGEWWTTLALCVNRGSFKYRPTNDQCPWTEFCVYMPTRHIYFKIPIYGFTPSDTENRIEEKTLDLWRDGRPDRHTDRQAGGV